MAWRTLPLETCGVLLAACLSIVCVRASSVQAATITVTNTDDSGPGSLRQALADAADGTTIKFADTLHGHTITLTTAGLTVRRNVTIEGPGADQLTIHNAGFQISADSAISGLTITHANPAIDVRPHGTVRLSDCVIKDSTRGGVRNEGGTVDITNCTISGNSAADGAFYINGGGIFNHFFENPATLTVSNSTISDNSAAKGGGGIYNEDGTVTVVSTTISGNTSNDSGGGIFIGGGHLASIVKIVDSTISGNTAVQAGGGIYNDGHTGVANLEVSNSTISGNSAATHGGGIVSVAPSFGMTQLIIGYSTVSGNSAPRGGALYTFGGPLSDNRNSSTVIASNTIFHAGATGGTVLNEGGLILSNDFNLLSDDGGGQFPHPADQKNVDPQLGPLQDNGGPTFTHALLRGSPAIDAGHPAPSNRPDFDQRGHGFARVVNGRIDIGAFEVQARPAPCDRREDDLGFAIDACKPSQPPLPPCSSVADLIERLNQTTLGGRLKNAVMLTLDAAQAAVSNGSGKNAREQVASFIDQVGVLENGGALDPLDVEALTSCAEEVAGSI